MRHAARLCAAGSNRPQTTRADVNAALARRSRLIDFILADIKDAKRQLGLDTEHARKLDGLLESWSETEKGARNTAAPATAQAAMKSCPTIARPNGNGAHKKNLDELSPVHDQMIAMIKLAFELDLTRVVAFTLSGGSSGQTWPSQGIHRAHHSLEHSGDVKSLVKIDTYYAEKFAGLLKSLKSVDDGNGKTALNNSSVFLGMECWSNSSSGHYLTNIPFVLAGQGGDRFKTGRIVDARGRNNNDIHVSCLRAAGIETNTFGLENLCQGPIV